MHDAPRALDISLIIPAYNEEGYIGACLDSVLQHADGKLKEIIVVDNASTDGTAAEVAKKPGVRLVAQPNKGLTHARQKGLEVSSSEYLAFIDADERIPADWVERIEYYVQKYPDMVALSGPVKYYDSSMALRAFGIAVQAVTFPFALLLADHWVLGGNFVAKRSALIEIGGFDTSIHFYGEDTNTGNRLAKVGRTLFKMDFFVYTSARRLHAEGVARTYARYTLNFLYQVIFRRSLTHEYTDVRA